MSKFKVGDKVIGNSDRNFITKKGWKGIVVEVGYGKIQVKGPDEKGNMQEFSVFPERFDLDTSEEESSKTKPTIEEVKKRYPIGTQYKSADSGTRVYTVTSHNFAGGGGWNYFFAEHGKGSFWYMGKWAEIISTPEEIPNPEEKPKPKFYDETEITVGISPADLCFLSHGTISISPEGEKTYITTDETASTLTSDIYAGIITPIKEPSQKVLGVQDAIVINKSETKNKIKVI